MRAMSAALTVSFQPSQRGFRDLPDVFRPAVHALNLPRWPNVESEFARDDDAVAHLPQRLADDLLLVNGPYTSALSKKVTPRSPRQANQLDAR